MIAIMLKKYGNYLNLGLFCASTLVLIAAQQKTAGFIILGMGVLSLLLCSKDFQKNFGLVYLCLAILGITPIDTTTDFPMALYMGIGLLSVIIIPYLITKKVYKNNLIKYPPLREKNWTKKRTFYLLFTAFVGYLLIPLMLRSDNSYLNWHLQPDFWSLTEAYFGLNFVGIWDELFFVITVLAILRKFFPFYIANIAQAILFTSFLYVVGFEGWGFIVVFIFALVQGYIFKKTKSLLYILAIHLTIDLVLHLSLVYLHFPHLFPYFIT
jgi:membrane protease YdiL (CAAX protease family)